MVFCMKTTLNIDDHLMQAAKKRAVERGVTLTRLIEDAIRTILKEGQDPDTKRYSFEEGWPVVKDARLPEVDISDRNALIESMEGRG